MTILFKKNNKTIRQVNYYIKRKLQRSITESENQSDFSTLASIKVCKAHQLKKKNRDKKIKVTFPLWRPSRCVRRTNFYANVQRTNHCKKTRSKDCETKNKLVGQVEDLNSTDINLKKIKKK